MYERFVTLHSFPWEVTAHKRLLRASIQLQTFKFLVIHVRNELNSKEQVCSAKH